MSRSTGSSRWNKRAPLHRLNKATGPRRAVVIGSTLGLALLGMSLCFSVANGHRSRQAWAAATTPTPIIVVVLTPGSRAAATTVVAGASANSAPSRLSTFRFTAADWVGGFYRGNSGFLGRPWVAIYGAQGEYPRATLGFRLSRAPAEPVTLSLAGLDDESQGKNTIALEINGRRVYEGPCWFNGWDGAGNGENAVWSEATITIPPALLKQGDNAVTVANLSPSANFNEPPYVLVAAGRIQAKGVTVAAATDLDAVRVTVTVRDDENG